jgi:D-alanyl-D-alanine carboxypeptidase/D-alanyl-D-alanine-endopeptidase (penicillin-binding protein 4)
VLDMLPVAAWSGTLADRYVGSSGAGVVRAKTGTLTSVSTLAGLVQDKGGRLLAFALMADRVGPSAADTDAAEAALDRVASTLASCGC